MTNLASYKMTIWASLQVEMDGSHVTANQQSQESDSFTQPTVTQHHLTVIISKCFSVHGMYSTYASSRYWADKWRRSRQICGRYRVPSGDSGYCGAATGGEGVMLIAIEERRNAAN